jgi:tetratricopeptide (TPR) repeat protein
MGNERGALERYYMAVELDSQYLEAWAQIGCLHAALGEPEAAVEAFDIALKVHPDFADAHYHKAETLWQLDRKQAARPHWQAYLDHVERGPWADLARVRLGLDPSASSEE